MANKNGISKKRSSRAISKLSLELCAVKLVQLGVLNSKHFASLKTHNQRPPEIPSRPESYYKNFPGWKKFIEIGRNGNDLGLIPEAIPTYDKVKASIRRLGISSKKEFVTAHRNNELLESTPRYPDKYYESEWESWESFLAPNLKYLQFEEARKIVHRIGLKTSSDWFEFCRIGKRPSYIPAHPHRDYQEFTTWEDFLREPSDKSTSE